MISKWDNVPSELQQYDFWLSWHYEPTPGRQKPIKKPNIGPGLWDDKKFYSFPAVLKEYDRCQNPNNQSRADGIGFVFTSKNNIVGIDIDGINENNIPAEIKAILTAGQSGYIEKSVSGAGYHIVGTTNNKQLLLDLMKSYNGRTGAKSKDLKIELYIKDRYFTVSGNVTNNHFGNIDFAVMLAFEYIAQKSALQSVATLYAGTERSDHTQTKQSVATIKEHAPERPIKAVNERSDLTQAEQSVATIPRPQNAFTDEEILSLPTLPIEKTIAIMFKANPTLKNILIDGIASTSDYYKNDNTDKDRSLSGFDIEIISKIMFWLYRYEDDEIMGFIKKSKLYRFQKGDDYLIRTIAKARETAVEFFPAVQRPTLAQQGKIKSWIDWKKNCAKAVKTL